MEHKSMGNTVTDDGIVHRCSCGWISRSCFSNAIASIEGEAHRESVSWCPFCKKSHAGSDACMGHYP